MNYEEFIIEILKIVKMRLGENYDVMCKDIVKNNSCVFKSMYITDRYADGHGMVTPAIYLEYWYERYQQGDKVDDIADKLLDIYYKSADRVKGFDVSSISGDNVEGSVFYRLVNYEANREQLENVPYIPFLDLAVTFHYCCSVEDRSVNSFRINDRLMNAWGLVIDDLFGYAENNMQEMFPDVLTTLDSVIQRFAGLDRELPDIPGKIYILTNTYGVNGAAALLYTTKLHMLAVKLDSDLYIIPSSVHELLIVPVQSGIDGDEIKKLVKEVNYSYVLKEERLSDNVYIFHKDSGEIDIY